MLRLEHIPEFQICLTYLIYMYNYIVYILYQISSITTIFVIIFVVLRNTNVECHSYDLC